MTTGIIVIDVSHWQGQWPHGAEETPWEVMQNNNVVGVILKATEGTGYVDDTFVKRRNLCMEHEVATCSYHFLKHGSIQSQMNLFLNTVEPRPGERMVLDWEDASVTVDEVKQAITYLSGDTRNIQITLYASSSFLQENVPDRPDATLALASLWVARYSSEPPYWPENVWPTWTLWQCTDNWQPDGYGPVDGNKFNGSVEGCIKWLEPVSSEPAPEPAPEPEVPTVSIVTTGRVVIIVDGEQIA